MIWSSKILSILSFLSGTLDGGHSFGVSLSKETLGPKSSLGINAGSLYSFKSETLNVELMP